MRNFYLTYDKLSAKLIFLYNMIKIFSKSDQLYLCVYHTQEAREKPLQEPCLCNREDAWLGVGYYFWLEEEFAHYWGKDSKLRERNSYYSIYKAFINRSLIYDTRDNYTKITSKVVEGKEYILDATFSERGYSLFNEYVEEAIKHIQEHSDSSLSLAQVHRYLADKIWPKLNIKGIIYDDLPVNSKLRDYSQIPPLFYKKRIQLVIFDKKLIEGFKIHLHMGN